MSEATASEDRRSRHVPIWFGIAGTVASLLIGWLVWIDNLKGFRDAGNLATLLSAVFSMIATTWLIVTVLRQGEELKLQREELRLQREETKRIADEAKIQNDTIRSQMRLSRQNFLIDRTQTLFSANEFDFGSFMDTIFHFVLDIFITKFPAEIPIALHHLRIDAKSDYLKCCLDDDFINSYGINKSLSSINLEYSQLEIDDNFDGLDLIGRFYLEAQAFDCEDWFLNELGYAITNLKRLNEGQVCLVLSVAALKAVRH